MIPILFDRNQTDFTTNGIGSLSECTSAVCTQELATEDGLGVYEIDLSYPMTGLHFEDLEYGKIIYAQPEAGKKPQPFEIYYISKPMSGQIAIRARHLALSRLKLIPISQFASSSRTATGAFQAIRDNALVTFPFTFETDIQTSAEFGTEIPATAYDLLLQMRTIYGGEFEFDEYAISLKRARGADHGYEIRYGKNLLDLKQESNIENTYTGCVVYWRGTTSSSTDVTVRSDVHRSQNAASFAFDRIEIVDASHEIQEIPAKADLDALAAEYVTQRNYGVPIVSVTISFINLADTEEYRQLASLANINLADVVTVVFPRLNVNAVSEVTQTEYNILRESYDSINIGEIKMTLSDTIARNAKVARDAVREAKAWANYVSERATEAVAGGYGGTIKTNYSFNDHVPTQQYILDNPDFDSAQRMIRNDIGGTYVSRNGGDTWDPLWEFTEDGDVAFYTNHITKGSTNGSLLKVGRIESQNEVSDERLRSYWDLEQGILHLVGVFEALDNDDPNDYATIKDGHLYVYQDGICKAQVGVSRSGIGGIQFSRDGSSVTCVLNETQLRTENVYCSALFINGSSITGMIPDVSGINATLADHERRITALGG